MDFDRCAALAHMTLEQITLKLAQMDAAYHAAMTTYIKERMELESYQRQITATYGITPQKG